MRSLKTNMHLNAAMLGMAGGMLMLCAASLAYATGVPNTFSAGQTVSASQMNDNFSAVEADIANPNVTGNITMVPATGTAGVIMKGTVPFMHDYGTNNTFLGANAGNFTMGGTSVQGKGNTAIGSATLTSNTIGYYNTASGYQALKSNTTGAGNTASGTRALYYNTDGYSNTATGYTALYSNTTGYANTASGSGALYFNTNGYSNTASGPAALYNNTTGYENTASGSGALQNNTSGYDNTSIGFYSLYANTTGNHNIALGVGAGNQVTGSYNIDIGNVGVAGESNTIRIGSPYLGTAFPAGQNRTFITGIYAVSTGGTASAVYIDANGQLGTANSSRRYKDDIATMGTASDVLMKLRPVTFYYKVDSKLKHRPLQYGLIAEEVAKVAPQLVNYDAKGEPQTVYYRFLAPMLLNEYQKQQHTIEAQAAQLKQQTAQLNEQKERVAALEKQSQEIVALRQEVARMSAILARLDPSKKLASSR